MKILHATEQEAMSVVLDRLDEVRGKKWMIAVWEVDGDKLTCVGRTLWEFPNDDFEKALELLRNVKEKEESVKPFVPEPLERADFPAPEDMPTKEDFKLTKENEPPPSDLPMGGSPKINLFGGGKDGEDD